VGAGERPAVQAAADRGIQRPGDRRAFLEHLASPIREGDFARAALEAQPGFAAARCDALLVARDRADFLRRVGRAFAQHAVQEENIEQAHRLRSDAGRRERVEVHQAHLDVFHAALAQRVQRALAAANAALRADLAVELVFDLQQRGCELAVFARLVADADFFVRRIRLEQRFFERCPIRVQAVEARRDRGLRVALVAEALPCAASVACGR
jgi:hypothetical protein